MTGRKLYLSPRGRAAFWLSNVGMIGMTVAFGVAGVVQVYLERRLGMDFMAVQKETSVHFVVLILCASVFTTGVIMYIVDFYKHGKPTDEAMEVSLN
jgi:nitric oxide reductase subunit B